jgi:hypothetical protein
MEVSDKMDPPANRPNSLTRLFTATPQIIDTHTVS